MSRTERKRITYDAASDTRHLDFEARDDKGRCDCCGNTWQKIYNRRERANAKHAIRNNNDAVRVKQPWY